MQLKKRIYTKIKYRELAYDEDDEEEDFPIITGETLGIDKSSIMLHYHNHIEICYVKRGTGSYLIDGNDYSFQAGDIFIINDNEVHLAYNDKDVIMQVALFKPTLLWNGAGYTFEMDSLQTIREIRKRLNHKITPSNKHYDLLVDIIKEIFTENDHKEEGYKLVVKAALMKLTATLRRCFSFEHSNEESSKVKNYYLLLPVFEYIKENYDKKITLEELAFVANMGTSNFSLVFKKSVGATPIEYLNKVRIARATQLLLQTDNKIIDIAADCGFFSLPHFINCFKKFTGKLPKDFRVFREYIN